MKRKISLLNLVVLACLGACSDNDDGLDPSAMIEIYNQPYRLESGVIWQSNTYLITSTVPYIFRDTYMKDGQQKTDEVVGYAMGPDSREIGNFMLSLYEPGLVFNKSLGKATGTGACITFQFASSELDKLMPGKYVYGTEKLENTFMAYLSSQYNTDIDVVPAEITEGTVNVEGDGEEYHIAFNGKTSFGGEVSGNYQGPLEFCRVNQQVSASYSDIHLDGLLDSVYMDNPLVVLPSNYIMDVNNGKAFFSTMTGACITANGVGKDKVDIALRWEDKQECFYFESPIRMRAHNGHDDQYNFPCHTIYMKAPDNFTDEDFENLDETGFHFEVIEEEVKIPTTPFETCYVFFFTGNGKKGVIRAKAFTPKKRVTEQVFVWTMTYDMNPWLLIDVKSMSDFLNPLIR